MQVLSGNTTDRIEATPTHAEEAWLTVEIAISRRADEDFVARVSFEDEASWAACRAGDPLAALEGAVQIARQRAGQRAGSELERR